MPTRMQTNAKNCEKMIINIVEDNAKQREKNHAQNNEKEMLSTANGNTAQNGGK